MAKSLLSVGLDVGTTTTQMVLSRLTVENRASAFAVPQMEITDRQVLYRGDVHFTPMTAGLVDADGLRALVLADYAAAGICREDVDTGAVIITGETSRKENAAQVLESLAGFAGEFVVATAGPHLESVLAAKGAGAVALSAESGKTVLHMDIGGGTANLALIRQGEIEKTGCLNVGGRLLKFRPDGEITYISPVLRQVTPLKIGDRPTPDAVAAVADYLVEALEMAAGLRPRGEALEALATREAGTPFVCDGAELFSFSGGVADCILQEFPPFAFGDMGPVLGQRIRKSLLCAHPWHTGRETIRATVIGAGCHSTRLSGSTVFLRDIRLPVKNLPVVTLSLREQADAEAIRRKLESQEGAAVLAMPGIEAPSYGQVSALADAICEAVGAGALYLCLQADMAKALGHAIGLRRTDPCLCIDRVALQAGDYLDIGLPIGPALPVVVKSLVLEKHDFRGVV